MSQQGQAPQGWIEASLGDVIELKYGKALPAKIRDGEHFPVYGSNGIVGYHSEPIVNGPALIIGRKGSIGEVHLSEKDCSPIDTTYFVDEFHGQPPSFWLHRLRCLNLTDLNRATALPGLNRNDAYQLKLLLPPLKEQYRIVEKTEALMARSSKARTALDTILPLLEKFRQSVLSSAFRGDLTADWRAQNPDVEPAEKLLERIRKDRRKRWEDEELAKMKAKGKTPKDDKWKGKYKDPEPVDTTDLPELPDGWCWATIDEIASVGTGATPKRSNAAYWNNGTIPWITSGALNEEFVNVPTEYVTENALKETNLTLYPPGTLLLAMYGEGKTRGKCAQLMMSATTNQAIAAITIEEGGQTLANLLKYFLVLNYEKTRMAATGGVQPNLNLNIVRKISFPLLPIKEQKVFNDKIESFLSKTESVSTISSQLLKQLSILDQSILTKAFRGELVPQDPNDEPASQLLERIKLERASFETEKKQKGKAGRKKATRKKEANAMAKKKERRSLVEVLQPHTSGLSPEELFQQAGFDEHSVDEFYVELKNEVVNGNIIEDRPDQERVTLRLNAA